MFYASKKYVLYVLTGIFLLMMTTIAHAEITGQCSNCHTMHNSQSGEKMTTFTDYTLTSPGNAQPYLLRGTCLGCHAQGTVNKIESLSGNDVPQVYHKDPSGDLAGGNFAYLLGNHGSGIADDSKGHNIIDFGDSDDTFTQPPGRRHDITNFAARFTCAGSGGCHGKRIGLGTGLRSLDGAHHGNTGNKLDTANDVFDSYRFLYKIKGLENNGQNNISSKWQNLNAVNHNEYFGDSIPMNYIPTGCGICHEGGTTVRPSNNTMSGHCATCHGYFHLLDGAGRSGVGDDETSPFTRHPTDVILPGSGEYAAYINYSTLAPVARQTPVPDNMSASVGAGDVVMCLSCHGAHATDYYKILRWDYKSTMLATAISGCNICHTSRN